MKTASTNRAANASFDATAEYAYEGGDLESLSVLRRYREWIVDYFVPFCTGTTVELGAGIGSISALLAPHIDRLDLVEPSPNLARRLGERFASDARIAVHAGDLEGFAAAADRRYDAVVMVNVLEHIKDDEAALARLFKLIRPGGHLMILVPALPWLYSRLDELVGHYRRYTRIELLDKVHGAGFAPVKSRYFDALGILPWLVLNTWWYMTLGRISLIGACTSGVANRSSMTSIKRSLKYRLG